MKNRFPINEIKNLVNYLIDNKLCDFYRNKYKNFNKKVDSYKNFQTLPFLDKQEIIDTPIKQRIYCNINQIKYYSFSSGTTNSNSPLVIPHNQEARKDSKTFGPDLLKRVGAKKVLVLLPPTSPFFYKIISWPPEGIIPIPVGAINLGMYAQVSNKIKPDSIVSTATILDNFIEELKKNSFNFNLIKWISLGGEYTTKKKLEYFKKIFPKASITFRYGSSETGGARGYRCQHLEDESPTIYHPAKNAFLEIIDEEGNVLKEGEIGEIVHTELEKKAFPMIRYKTGDIAKLLYKKCPCGNNWIIDIEGRKEHDFLKYSGTVINTKSIELALSEIKDLAGEKFQLHISEEEIQNKIKPRLELKIQIKKDLNQIQREFIINQFSKKLFLTTGKTLESLVNAGIFLPLRLTVLKEWPQDGTKQKIIISHFSD